MHDTDATVMLKLEYAVSSRAERVYNGNALRVFCRGWRHPATDVLFLFKTIYCTEISVCRGYCVRSGSDSPNKARLG